MASGAVMGSPVQGFSSPGSEKAADWSGVFSGGISSCWQSGSILSHHQDGDVSPKAPSSPASRSSARRGTRMGLGFTRTFSGFSEPGTLQSSPGKKPKTVRGMVSKKKIRFQQEGFDLDLTYINSQVIAMGFPATGAEAQYRNPAVQVERFLNMRHPNAYRVYNLCEERKYDSPRRFEGHHLTFPFRDHNPPVPFSLVPDFCANAAEFLEENPDNVVAIHCKAGKGRTGVMISCLFLTQAHSDAQLRGEPLSLTAEQALEEFGAARTTDGQGVTIASQMRYVKYWEFILRTTNGQLPRPRKVRLDKVVIYTTIRPSGGLPEVYFVVQQGPRELGGRLVDLFDSRKHIPQKQALREGRADEKSPVQIFNLAARLPACLCWCTGDIIVKVKAKKRVGSDPTLFHWWLNCDIDPGVAQGHIVLKKSELDKACKDRKHEHYHQDLRVEVFFSSPPSQAPAPAPAGCASLTPVPRMFSDGSPVSAVRTSSTPVTMTGVTGNSISSPTTLNASGTNMTATSAGLPPSQGLTGVGRGRKESFRTVGEASKYDIGKLHVTALVAQGLPGDQEKDEVFAVVRCRGTEAGRTENAPLRLEVSWYGYTDWCFGVEQPQACSREML
eukprot:Hpha_TRINITY_DN12135_c0_g1::TRINITY_DN12135_c0_g1_i3::g.81751::m.81751/K01110/PTEN; phosphatidylinositol-3,4,5-trisphosphate 3-phosphatase and dual-specificity protein phosphatase PTEN